MEAEFIAAHSAGKIARYLRVILAQLGYQQKEPTPAYAGSEPALKATSGSMPPAERTRHMGLRFFATQDWREGDGTEGSGGLAMVHIPGTLNCSDDLTKSLGRVLHGRHLMKQGTCSRAKGELCSRMRLAS